MYQSTEAFGNLIQQDSRTFKSLITYDDISITDAKSIKFTGGSEGEDDFSLGSVISQYVTVTIPDCAGAIENHEFLLQIGMDVDGLTEYIPIGYFTAGKPKKTEDQIEFTAYDRMMKLEMPFSSSLPDNTDTVSILKRITEITRVSVATDGLDAIAMANPKGYSCREVLSYVAQMYGGFAICNRQGQIEIHTYIDSDYKAGTGRYWDNFEHNEYLFSIEKLTCYTGKDEEGNSSSISAGSGERTVSFSNPFMTEEALNNIFSALSRFSYMPGNLKLLGDPRLDPWDIITVEDLNGDSYKVPVMKMEWEYDGGLTHTIEAVGLSEEETNTDYKGPQTKEMDRYYAQLVMIDHAMINKLDVDTAKITYATITNLNATNANIEKLNADVGNFRDLTATQFKAANAKIDILDGNYANIKTLLSGSAGVGDLQNIHLTSQNAVIDSALIRNAVMQTVTISDLLAGTISTDKFTIVSDDGGIKIQGATQQWRDANGIVRLQAGRDASGSFTFALFDETGKGTLIDASGVQKGAIADEVIVDSMISDNANIAASKLDINSLFKEINNSAQVIKSSRIWFDDSGQSLNQAYSQMSKNITFVQETASSATSTAKAASDTADAAADAARKALDTLSGISTLDAVGALLDNDAHVVHTNPDGTGGDYTNCHTTMRIYLGDTDVSEHIDAINVTASEGIAGTWNARTRTYQVTDMTTDDGYVDIEAQYGLESKALMLSGKVLTINGKLLLIKNNGVWIRKRFSVSKSKDGKIGISYNIQTSSLVMRKQKDGKTLLPSSVTFSAYKNDNGLISSYAGIFQIEESRDSGKTYNIVYGSSGAEILKIYTPTGPDINIIRCTLYDETGVQTLDVQTVTIIADAEGFFEDIKKAQDTADEAKEAISTTNNKVADIQTGIDGIRANLSEVTTDLHGLTNNTLIYNARYHDNGDGTTTLTAVVYKDGREVTREYPSSWYSWTRKTESGETFLGYGYTITVNNEDYMFGGVVVGRFTTYKQQILTVSRGTLILSGKAICFSIDA